MRVTYEEQDDLFDIFKGLRISTMERTCEITTA